MLEIDSHSNLKNFVRANNIQWAHIFSFGRIVSRYLRKKEQFLINSEIFITNKWYSALLIPLFLNEENSLCIMPRQKIESLKESQLDLFRMLEFNFELRNDEILFSNHQIKFLTFEQLIKTFLNGQKIINQNIIFTEAENIKENIRHNSKLVLAKKDWFEYSVDFQKNKEIKKTYNYLKEKFFLKSIPNKKYIYLDQSEINLLIDVFSKYENHSKKFLKIKNAFNAGWLCWVILDHNNFEWILNLEPIDELLEVRELFLQNNFLLLSSLRQDNFIDKYLRNLNLRIKKIKFQGDFKEREIMIYAPSKQILPNNPLFTQSIVDKCKKLIVFRKGLTVVLSNDSDLKLNLATLLAAEYGQRVLLENKPELNNQILCASYDWWIKNKFLIEPPEQIIIPLLPIPSMGDPLVEIKVSHYKKQSKDWFREFLLLETFEKIDKVVPPLRRNSGKLIIFDSRINMRGWGRQILKIIQPSKIISYISPFE